MSRVEGGKDERKKADAARQRESVRTQRGARGVEGLCTGPGPGGSGRGGRRPWRPPRAVGAGGGRAT